MTQIVGILNITPDSFSDGGKWLNPDKAYARMMEMVEQGADVIDLGAESTRPGAALLTHAEEWERLQPVLQRHLRALADDVVLSVDSRHPETIQKALDYGIHWMNDVSGLRSPQMQQLAAQYPVKVILMHNLGFPPSPNNILPEDADPVQLIFDWAENKLKHLESVGIAREKIIFDPGLGFGKNAQQSVDIVRDARRFKHLGVPVLFGHSRKSFLYYITGEEKPEDRDAETNAMTLYLARQDIDYVRVHNIHTAAKTLKVMRAIEAVNA